MMGSSKDKARVCPPDSRCRYKPSFGLSFLIAALSQALPVQGAELLDETRQLIQSGHTADAYRILDPLQERRAGNPDYDYLLGVSALESGYPARAAFAFQRVLERRPDDSQTRTELARAYLLMGENDLAKAEFDRVLKQAPPAPIRAAVGRYLGAIERLDAGGTSSNLSGFLELGTGYDGNVNAATSDDSILVPVLDFAEVPLEQTAVSRADGFAGLRGHLRYGQSVDDNVRMFVGGKGERQNYFSQSEFVRTRFDLFTGFNVLQGRNRYTATVMGERFWLDGGTNREQLGLNLHWQHIADARNQFTAFMQFSGFRYPEQAARDVNQGAGGIGWAHALDMPGTPVIYAGGYAGKDNEQDPLRSDIGRNFWGTRLGGNYSLTERTSIDANFYYQRSLYGDIDPYFLKTRKDDLTDFAVSLEYRIGREWSASAKVRYTNNESTIGITEYVRSQTMVSLRRDFI